MQKVVIKTPETVELDSLLDKKQLGILVYKRRRSAENSSSEYAMLTRLKDYGHAVQWGFVDMYGSDVSPCYVGISARDAIERCITSGREVFRINSLADVQKLHCH